MWLNQLKQLLFKQQDAPVARQNIGEKLKCPSTLSAELNSVTPERPIFFDPALKHFESAHRAGEPLFQDPNHAARWQSIRFTVLHHILREFSQAQFEKNLILRGSVVMTSWFPDHARNPGDLDWVVIPQHLQANGEAAATLLESILKTLQGAEIDSNLRIPDVSFAMEEIWTYEKAPGIRMIVPWAYAQDGIFDGTIQMDFVFGEVIPSTNVTTTLKFSGCEPIDIRTASRAQSLAWKLSWLCTDSYAMGKDLYDAVLLAESTEISRPLLEQTFLAAETDFVDPMRCLTETSIRNLTVDWEEFIREYPNISGTAQAWTDRLADALAPVLAPQ